MEQLMFARFSVQFRYILPSVTLLATACPAQPAGADTGDLIVCTSPTGAETRKIHSIFTAAGAAPCKVSYETATGTKIAADAKFDVNKCRGVATRVKTNLERSGWQCHGAGDPSTAGAEQDPAPAVAPVPVPATLSPPAAKSVPALDDRMAVRQLTEQPWAEECIYGYPGKWKRNAELSDGEIDVYPGPGEPLARHNFVYSVGNARFSHLDRVFIAGRAMPWEEVQTYATSIQRSDFDAAVNLRASHAGQFISQHVLDSLAGGGDSEFEKRGNLDLRGRYLSDGKFTTTNEAVDIVVQDQLLIASLVFLPTVNREPSITAEPIGFTFSCSALSTMDLSAFRDLCKTLIEKATLNEHSAEGECEYSSAGRLEFSKR
jgi:hypothetical protein